MAFAGRDFPTVRFHNVGSEPYLTISFYRQNISARPPPSSGRACAIIRLIYTYKTYTFSKVPETLYLCGFQQMPGYKIPTVRVQNPDGQGTKSRRSDFIMSAVNHI